MATPPSRPAPDPDRLKLYAFNLFTKLEGAVTGAMVHLGDRLGLYRALDAAGRPLTSAELAAAAGLDERWVREWAYNQGAAGLLDIDEDERLSLSPEAVAVMVDDTSPAFGMGSSRASRGLMATVEEMPAAFRSGLGYDYDSHGEDGAAGVERAFEPWYRHYLSRSACRRWTAWSSGWRPEGRWPTSAAGRASPCCLVAQAYPAASSTATTSPSSPWSGPSSKPGRGRADERPLPRRPREPLPADESVDLVTTFDCIHDMTHPQEMMAAIRARRRRRRHVAARRHQGPRHLRRERRQEPHGGADVRRVRCCRACPRRCRSRVGPGWARSAFRSRRPGRWRRPPASPASAGSTSTTPSTPSTRSSSTAPPRRTARVVDNWAGRSLD